MIAGNPRSWRNKNPGNLRPTALPDQWRGEVALDNAPGGPFSIFGHVQYGWRALAICLRTYQTRYKLRTVHAMLTRYAPDMENDTGAYISNVCYSLGIKPRDEINVEDFATARALVTAIAAHEGGRSCPAWDEDDKRKGLSLAGIIAPGFHN